MKLKSYNAENCKARISGLFLSITKAGMIAFSSEAAELIGIKDNCKIEFFNDEENPEDWFVGLSKSATAFNLREKSKNGTWCIQNSFLAKSILQSLKEPPEGSVRIMMSKECEKTGGGQIYPLITAAVKAKTKLK